MRTARTWGVESNEPVTAMLLTADVLSPSTAGNDRLKKRALYFERVLDAS